jgi:uncharacterized membrane protein
VPLPTALGSARPLWNSVGLRSLPRVTEERVLIAHLQTHLLGLIHVLFALLALVSGCSVLFLRKGNRLHRWIGRTYLFSMLGLNITALMDYELFGYFGPFHWMALFSLASVLVAYRAVLRKAPGWRYTHAYFMVGSYVGLLAATAAETASRVPGWSFGPTVIISSAVAIVLGVALMKKWIPRALQRPG